MIIELNKIDLRIIFTDLLYEFNDYVIFNYLMIFVCIDPIINCFIKSTLLYKTLSLSLKFMKLCVKFMKLCVKFI